MFAKPVIKLVVFVKKLAILNRNVVARQVQTSHSTEALTHSDNTKITRIVSADKEALHSAYSEDEDHVFHVTGYLGKPHNPHVDIKAKIADQASEIGFLIDSGSTVNTLLNQDYKRLVGKHPDPKLTLTPSTAIVKPLNSNTPVGVLGEFTATIETCSYRKTPVKEMFTIGTFQVAEGLTAAAVSVFGRTTAIDLGMLRVGPNEHPLRNITCSCHPFRCQS